MAALDQAPGAPAAEEKRLSPPDNLMTVQYQTIQALSHKSRACSHQSARHISAFRSDLRTQGFFVSSAKISSDPSTEGLNGSSPFYLPTPPVDPSSALTKAEVLQLINHAPQSEIELHTLVEELSERFEPDQVANLLTCINAHLPAPLHSGENEETASPAPMSSNGVDHLSSASHRHPSATRRASDDLDEEEAALNENEGDFLHEIAVEDGVGADEDD